jgi:signal transduction histidine kinase
MNKMSADKKLTVGTKRQVELPLKRSTESKVSRSKVLFQLKSELNRLQLRDREWKLMFNMLGHDLKEPLVTLEGFTKLLEEEGTSPADQKRYLKIIREAINSLHSLVGSLQTVAKLYHDPHDLVEVSLREIIQNVVSSLSDKIQRTGADVRIEFDDYLIRGDTVRLYQIFLNLIANSLKFHKKDTPPVIRINARKSGEFYKISISDNGVGMSSEDLKKIFEPFTQIDTSAGGMGMGLSIVKRIAESFGGRVSVKSQQGTGTVFSVHLPRGES